MIGPVKTSVTAFACLASREWLSDQRIPEVSSANWLTRSLGQLRHIESFLCGGGRLLQRFDEDLVRTRNGRMTLTGYSQMSFPDPSLSESWDVWDYEQGVREASRASSWCGLRT